jgi:hypothetical protein
MIVLFVRKQEKEIDTCDVNKDTCDVNIIFQ